MERSTPSPSARLPFGPYVGRTVDEVAVIDPGYLLDVIAEAVGPAELRAEAARALVVRQRLVGSAGQASLPRAQTSSSQGSSLTGQPQRGRWLRARIHSLPPWLMLLVAGATFLLILSLATLVGWPGRVGRPSAGLGLADLGDASSPAQPGIVGLASAGKKPIALSTVDVRAPISQAGTISTTPGAGGVLSAELRAGQPGGQAAVPPCGERVPGAISAAEARQYVDTFQAVEFKVVRTKDTGRVTYLNSHDPYHGHFYVAIFPGDYEKFSQPPALLFRGKCIVVQGLIELYRGTPQIVLRSPEDVRILGD